MFDALFVRGKKKKKKKIRPLIPPPINETALVLFHCVDWKKRIVSMAAETEGIAVENMENDEKEEEEANMEEDSGSDDESEDEEDKNAPRIAELETQVMLCAAVAER